MKHLKKNLAVGLMFVFAFVVSCKKDALDLADPSIVQENKIEGEQILIDLAKIHLLGHDILNVTKTSSGYRLGNGAVLSRESLEANDLFDKSAHSVAEIVDINNKVRILDVAIGDVNYPRTHKFYSNFSAHVNSSLALYNSLKTNLRFNRAKNTFDANIVINATKTPLLTSLLLPLSPFTGISYGFPANGEPARYVQIHPVTTDAFTDNQLVSLIAHEIGHSVGFRHTWEPVKNENTNLALELNGVNLSNNVQQFYGLLNALFQRDVFNMLDSETKLQQVKAVIELYISTSTNDIGATGVGRNQPGLIGGLLGVVFNVLYRILPDLERGIHTTSTLAAQQYKNYHIYGTPLDFAGTIDNHSDQHSFMGYRNNSTTLNDIFTSHDKIALYSLYGNADQKRRVRQVFTKFGRIQSSFSSRSFESLLTEIRDLGSN